MDLTDKITDRQVVKSATIDGLSHSEDRFDELKTVPELPEVSMQGSEETKSVQ